MSGLKRYKHVGNIKVYCYRWYLATQDGSFRTMSYTSKPKIKGGSAKRIKNTFEYMHPDRTDGFYGFEQDLPDFKEIFNWT